MKHIAYHRTYLPLLFTGIILLSFTQVFAEEPVSNNTDTQRMDHSQMNHEQMMQAASRGEAREERRTALSTRFQDRMTNLGQNVTKRLTAALDRMENITARIESRVQKLKAQGIDMGSVETKLIEVRSALSKTSEAITNIGSVQLAVGSDTPKTSFAAIRNQFNIVRAELGNTQTLLRETLTLLKNSGSLQKIVEDATSTSTDTAGKKLEVQ